MRGAGLALRSLPCRCGRQSTERAGIALPRSYSPAQLSEKEGTLAATRRQLDAAQQEQQRLASQLQAGLTSAGAGAAAQAAAAAAQARLQELTRKAEEEQSNGQIKLATVSRASQQTPRFGARPC